MCMVRHVVAAAVVAEAPGTAAASSGRSNGSILHAPLACRRGPGPTGTPPLGQRIRGPGCAGSLGRSPCRSQGPVRTRPGAAPRVKGPPSARRRTCQYAASLAPMQVRTGGRSTKPIGAPCQNTGSSSATVRRQCSTTRQVCACVLPLYRPPTCSRCGPTVEQMPARMVAMSASPSLGTGTGQSERSLSPSPSLNCRACMPCRLPPQ